MSELVERLRRASRRPPRYLAKRLVEMAVFRLRRPWASVLPRIVTAGSVVNAAGAGSVDAFWKMQQDAPFFLAPSQREEWARAFKARFDGVPDKVIDAAERALRHEFDLLGSGAVNLGPRLPWHTDFKT